MVRLTDEQRNAVEHPGHSVVVACPGSGKTRCIVSKLMRCAEDIRDSARRIACITYTNVAANEISYRLQRSGLTGDDELCDISTIHSFCQNNILRYHFWRIPELSGGYSVLTPDADLYQEYVDAIGDQFGLDRYEKEAFERLNRRPCGSPIVSSGLPEQAATAFWSALLEDGYIDFTGLVYYSYRLLSAFPSLRKNIAARYQFILVDEFQDTSALQCEIFKLIHAEASTTFFLVGDPEQSIYSFAGAEPRLMSNFSEHIGAKQFPLSGNFRSTKVIVTSAEQIIARNPAMIAVGERALVSIEVVRESSGDAVQSIIDYFIPTIDEYGYEFGDCAILAPSWFQLRPVGTSLRDYGIPVVGPGARPYKRTNLFADFSEQVCGQFAKPDPALMRSAERSLFRLLETVTGKPNFDVFSFRGRTVLLKLLDAGRNLADQYGAVDPWLPVAAEEFRRILVQDGMLGGKSGRFIVQSAMSMLTEMREKDIDPLNTDLNALGMFANPRNCIKLLTFHGSKGREFSGVAMIGLQDGLIPFHNRHNQLTLESEAESRRLFYVAITRAKYFCSLFSDPSDWRPPCRFLSDLDID